MRAALMLLAAVIVTGLLGYSAYVVAPGEPMTISYTVVKPVYETKTFAAQYPAITPDGKIEKRVTTFNYTVGQLVTEARERTIINNPDAKLHFWVLVAACIFCAAYSTFVLCEWMLLRVSGAGKKRFGDSEKRLNTIVAFGFGAITGIITVGNRGQENSAELQQALATLESSQAQVAAMGNLLAMSERNRQEIVGKIQRVFGPSPDDGLSDPVLPDEQPGPAPEPPGPNDTPPAAK